MKKKLIAKISIVLTAICITLVLSGCTANTKLQSRMEDYDIGWNYKILRDKETGVLYIGYKAYTPMVDAKGNVIVVN